MLISYSVSGFGLTDGGFAGLIWMFVIVFVGFIFVYASMAEMASMYGTPVATLNHFLTLCRAPTSGGQYHWVSEFAPKRQQKFLSYITGSKNLAGFLTEIF